jgi:phosphoglycolate phosphatase
MIRTIPGSAMSSDRTRSVFFDLDGTLTDPGEGIVRSMQAAFRAIGEDPPPVSSLAGCVGPPLRQNFLDLGAEPEQIDTLVRSYRRRYREVGMLENRVYAGIPDLLTRLRSLGLRLYVATSKPTAFALAILAHLDLQESFQDVFGTTLDGGLTDKRDLVAHARRVAGFSPHRSALVGDRKFDIEAARSQGMLAIGALWGYGSRRELEVAGADGLASRPAAVLDILRERFHVP